MSIKVQIGYPLSTLPNAHGFQFRGVEENGDLLPCRVKMDEQGLHYAVCENTGAKVLHRLRGWMQWLPNQKAALAEDAMQRLTDEEIRRIDDATPFHEGADWAIRFARAIERAPGIGGEE